jgi:hypothetical protein
MHEICCHSSILGIAQKSTGLDRSILASGLQVTHI